MAITVGVPLYEIRRRVQTGEVFYSQRKGKDRKLLTLKSINRKIKAVRMAEKKARERKGGE